MDVPGAHPPAVERDDLFLNSGDIPLVLGDNLRLKLAVPVPGDVNLEFPVLALELLGGMAVALVCDSKVTANYSANPTDPFGISIKLPILSRNYTYMLESYYIP